MPAIIAVVLIAIVALTVLGIAAHILFSPWLLLVAIGILAIRQVKATLRPVEISPQNAYLRRLQHQLVAENDLSARSTGKEPQRRLRITPSPKEPTL